MKNFRFSIGKFFKKAYFKVVKHQYKALMDLGFKGRKRHG